MSTTKWVLEPGHSEVQFKVKHLMITNVSGTFTKINGSIETEDDKFTKAKIEFTADASTVNTNNPDRDTHLKSGDFFDAENNPEIKFASNDFNASEGKVQGNFTMRGVTKLATFDVEFAGTNTDPFGNEKAGFSVSGKINRKDWGLNWNAALETGGVLVSEEVKITAELQFVKSK